MKLAFKKKNSNEVGSKTPNPKKKKFIKKIIIAVVITAIVLLILSRLGGGRVQPAGGGYTLYTVSRRDITSVLTGTATVQPKDTYTVTSSVDADILSDYFEENDTVEKDAVMYQLDSSSSSSLERNIERAQKSYDKAVENIDKLSVRSKIAGRITELYVDVGDEVMAGARIAEVIDDEYMYVKVPFSIYDAKSFSVGQSASVVTEANFESVGATISDISGNVKTSASGIRTQTVTLKVKNEGSLYEGEAASARVGEISSIESGVFEYGSGCRKTVTAEVSGDVLSLVCREGDGVAKNGVVIKLENDDLYDAADDAKSELESARDMLDKYTIKAPISGTVVQKDYKAGETTSVGRTLAVIYDMSYLKFNLAVDELDIKKISVGQDVQITADTLEGVISGRVSAISIVGTTTSNSTTYPVTVIIDDPGELLPGMNVEASIVLSNSRDCIAVPLDAVSRGHTVLKLKSDKTENLSEEDFDRVPVEVGNSDDDFTEIISGLEVGDVIGVEVQPRVNNNFYFGMGGNAGAGYAGPPSGGGFSGRGGM